MAASTTRSAGHDLGLLIARIALGVIFAAHGYQKVFGMGVGNVTGMFSGLGIPLAEVVGPFVAFLELIGGVLLALGAFTRIVGLLLAIDMLVAALLVHASAGIFIDQGGWELVGALGAGALALAAAGAGRFSADAVVLGRGGGSRSRAASTSDS